MAGRLVKVAKELNVGTSTIVDFLLQNGFEIDNKPTAKVTEEMYDALVQEFQSSMAVKEQAEKVVLGNNRVTQQQEEPKETEESKESDFVETQKEKIAGLKVVGKIDLENKEKEEKKEEEPQEEEVQEDQKTPETAEDTPVEDPKPKEEEQEKEEKPKKEEKEDIIRADAPQLEGLKVQGKIDVEQFKPKKSEKKKEEKKDTDADSGAGRRRRKRKVVVREVDNRQGKDRHRRKGDKRSKGKKQDEEIQHVSQKEIDEKIKATMARLSGSSSKKRQKLRRDKRDSIREKEELKQQQQAENETLQVTEFISAQELANLLDAPVTEIITTCMNLGVIVSINQRLDAEIIELVASEFGQEIEFVTAEDELEEEEIIDDPEDLQPRAPIVTVMGHVDHGKTSLLDYIRKAKVVEGEAGGITQHIGAYEVRVDEKAITFLDTPGHEAFTAMRARGAKVTDVAVIIISADDRIMPQTKEAISHAQAAGVPIVFAINKIDKDGADPNRIKQELAEMDLLIEEWGGKYQSQDISAKTGQNVEELLEKILLEAEVLELGANPDRLAIGTVIEATLEKGRGYVCKSLIQNGTLRIGDPIIAGEHSGRVKAMFNDKGERVDEAGPAKPVAILGLNGAPQAGERFKATETEQEAKAVATKRAQIIREQTNRSSKRISLEEIGRRLALGSFKELNLIVKGDVDGSIEALSDSLIKLSVESIQVNVIHKAVGQIIESDVLLASASDAIIIGFQVRPSLAARKLAEAEGVEIKTYSVIYKAIDEIKAAMEGMLEPTKEEQVVSQLTVRETFKISKIGTIAGCIVDEGSITRNTHVRVIRDGIVVYPTKEGQHGEISSLKRFKDDVKEVKSGMECGLTIKNFNDLKVGDNIEGYKIVEVAQSL